LSEFQDELSVALEAARAASRIHQQRLGTVPNEDWSQKGVADFVTHVDREAEARIVEIIANRFPNHDILAEEDDSTSARASDWLWVVDPLDGTTNFLHQYPMYCASVALLHDGEPVAGAVVCGPTGEEWSASRGGGAQRNGAPITVSATSRMDHALIGTGFPFKLPGVLEDYLNQFRSVFPHVSDIRRAGSAAMDLCHVATGYFDGFWELDLRPWDYAAGALMVREAGGVVTALDGGEPDWSAGGGVIAGNPKVYSALFAILHQGS